MYSSLILINVGQCSISKLLFLETQRDHDSNINIKDGADGRDHVHMPVVKFQTFLVKKLGKRIYIHFQYTLESNNEHNQSCLYIN